MTTAKEVLQMIKDNDVKYADFRFTDPRGKWQHVTFDIGMIEEETFAEGMVKSQGVGDTIYFGPEAEFFVFDDVKYAAEPYNTGFKLDSTEFPTNSDTEYEGGNLGHHVGTKKGYFPVPPQDSAQDMRSEMLGAMARMGCVVEKHELIAQQP